MKSEKLNMSLISSQMLIILSLKVLGFAAFSEIPIVTQTIKVGLGLLSTLMVLLIHTNLERKGER